MAAKQDMENRRTSAMTSNNKHQQKPSFEVKRIDGSQSQQTGVMNALTAFEMEAVKIEQSQMQSHQQ
jgi:hypothetical protein